MQYTYLKSRPLNDEERRRLRIAVGADLRLRGVVTGSSRLRLVNEVLALIAKPAQGVKEQALYWLLSYGKPRLMGRLIAALAGTSPAAAELKALQHADPAMLLPREHISPDFQKVQTAPEPRTALICFTGNAQKLNIPVHLFHCLAAGKFDLVFYLRDFEKQRFTHGIPGMAGNLAELGQALRRQIPEGCHIAILGTSGGGYAAARIAEDLGAARLALFSAPLWFKEMAAVSSPARLPGTAVGLFFATQNKLDRRLADDWMQTDYASSIHWMETDTHGTLRQVLENDRFDALLDWLRGSPLLDLEARDEQPARWFPGLLKSLRHARA